MKKLFTFLLAVICASVMFGQNDKEVAVLEPKVIQGTVSKNDILIISSSMRKAFTQIEGYSAFTRTSQALIDAEQAFQRSGRVADNQIKAIGQQTGCAYICVFTLSKDENEIIVNSEIIDIVTGKIENSDWVALNVSDRNDVMKQCQMLAYNLLGVKHTGNSTSRTSGGNSRIEVMKNVTRSSDEVLIFVENNEKLFGKKENIIANKVKADLANKGCSFVDYAEQADFHLTINANVRFSSQNENLVFCYADVEVELFDNKKQKAVFADSYSEKGGSSSQEKAGRKAMEAAANEITEKLTKWLQ